MGTFGEKWRSKFAVARSRFPSPVLGPAAPGNISVPQKPQARQSGNSDRLPASPREGKKVSTEIPNASSQYSQLPDLHATSKTRVLEGSISSTRLWAKAIEEVKILEEWKTYIAIVEEYGLKATGPDNLDGNTTRASSSQFPAFASTPTEIAAIAARMRDLTAPKVSFRLGGRDVIVREVYDKVVTCLSAVKDIGASATALNPYAAVAWGGLQFFMQAAVNNREVRELCWEELPHITYLISRYQTFEEVYSRRRSQRSDAHLEKSLIQLFTSILKYEVVVVNYAGSRTTRLKSAFQDKSKSALQQILDEIKRCEDDLTRVQTVVDREIDDSNYQSTLALSLDLQKSLAKLDKILQTTTVDLQSISQFVDSQRRATILQWVSPIKYRNAHNKSEKTAMSGTGQWLLNLDIYTSWRTSRAPGTLWLHGFMGSGKSCLTHVVIEDLERTVDVSIGERLVYFYCDGTDADGANQIANTANILRCFVKQLSNPGNRQELINIVIDTYNENQHKADLTEQQSLNMILALVRDSISTVFVIDGLDECPDEVQRGLIRCLKYLLASSTSLVKVFFSCRPTPHVSDLLTSFDPRMVDVAKNNADDISSLVKARIKDAAATPGLQSLYIKGKHDQTQAVMEKLNGHAQGMFRWVQLCFSYLHSSITYGEMSRRLRQLDTLKDLFDLYDVIYEEMMGPRDEESQVAIRTILIFLLYGENIPQPHGNQTFGDGPDSQPSTSFLKFGDSETSSDSKMVQAERCLTNHLAGVAFRIEDCLVNEDVYTTEEILALCSSFVTLDSQSLVLALPHFSVREYLVKRHSTQYSAVNGHAYLAQLCMEVFCESGTPGPFSHTISFFKPYSALKWMNHLVRLLASDPRKRALDSILCEFEDLRSTLHAFLVCSHATEGFQRWANWLQTNLSDSDLENAFTTSIAIPLYTSPPSSFLSLVLLDYKWDTLKAERAILDPRSSSIHAVALARNTKTIDWLVEQGFDIHAVDEEGFGALSYVLGYKIGYVQLSPLLASYEAGRYDKEAIFKKLIKHGVNVNGHDMLGQTHIHHVLQNYASLDATEGKLLQNVRLLAENGANLLAIDIFRRSAIDVAIGQDLGPSIVEYLSPLILKYGAVKGGGPLPYGATPFHYVAKHCNEETIRLWVEHGADLHASDSRRMKPVDAARESGRVSVAEYLDSIERTPRSCPEDPDSNTEEIA